MRYHLRSLLLFILLIAVLLKCFLALVYLPYRCEVRKMDELKSLGVTYSAARRGPRLVRRLFGDRGSHRVVTVIQEFVARFPGHDQV